MIKERKYPILSLVLGICLIAPHFLWGDEEESLKDSYIQETLVIKDHLAYGYATPVVITPPLNNWGIWNKGGRLSIDFNGEPSLFTITTDGAAAIFGTNYGITDVINDSSIFSQINVTNLSSDTGALNVDTSAVINITKLKMNVSGSQDNTIGSSASTGGSIQLNESLIEIRGNNSCGFFSNGVDTAFNPSTITSQDSSIQLFSQAGVGVIAEEGGKVQLNASELSIEGDSFNGLMARGTDSRSYPSTITCENSSIILGSGEGLGVLSEGGGMIQLNHSQINMGTETSNSYSYKGLVATSEDSNSTISKIVCEDTSITLFSNTSYGALAQIGGDIQLDDSNMDVNSSEEGYGAFAIYGGNITLNGSDVKISGDADKSKGLAAIGRDENAKLSMISCQDSNINVMGNNTAWGAHTSGGGEIKLNQSPIKVEGIDCYGLLSELSDSQSYPSMISCQESNITVGGKGDPRRKEVSKTARGAYVRGGGKIELNQSPMEVEGIECYGLLAEFSDSQSYPSMISYQDSTIFVNGKSPSGWGNTSNTAWGAYTDTGANIQLSTTTMNVSAQNCYGLYAKGTDMHSTPSTINFQGSSIVLDGDVVKGAFVENGGLVTFTGEGGNVSSNHPFNIRIRGRNSSNPSYGLYADSQGSIQVRQMDIFMDAPLAVGAQATAKDSSITLDGVNMHFSQPNAVGVGLESGSTVTLNASTLMNKEALGKKKRTRRALRLSQDSIYPAIYSGATGIDESNSLKMTDGSIGGNFSHLIYVDQSHLEATFQGSSAVSSNLQAPLCHVEKDSLVTMQAYDNASLTGDLEGEGNIKLSLLNNASWRGKRLEVLKPLVQLEIGQNALWEVTGSSSIDQVNNQRGTIEMAAIKDAAATFLEIHEYQGTGGNVILNTALGFNNSPSDLIQINHYTATSPTVVTIQNQSAPQKMVLSHTVPLIKVAKSEPLDEGAFTFNQFINGERYNYTFQYDPRDPLWHIWGLQLEEKISHTPLYAALPSLALSYNLSLIDTFHERMGSLSYSKESSKVWSRYSYQKGDIAQKLQGSVIKRTGSSYTNQTFQVGSTLLSMKHQNGHQDDIGVYGALGEAANHVPLEKAFSGKNGMNIQSAATYWTHFGPLGEYLDTVIQGSYYRTQSTALENVAKTTGFGITGSLEGGIPFQIEPRFFIEPEVQMISQLMHLHSFAEENSRIHLKNISSFVTRLGLRVAKDWMLSEKKLSIWARVSDYYEWLEGAIITKDYSLNPIISSSEPLKSWGEFNLGVDASLSPTVSLYGSAGYTTDFSSSHAQDVQLGMKWRW